MSSIKGTNVAAPVVPFDTTDAHPSHEAKYGKGGYRSVADAAARSAIPAARREAGMLVYEASTGKVWQLADGLEEWSEFVTSSMPSIADVTGLQTALDGKLALAGGQMNSSAVVTFSDATNDSEIGGWGFGVEVTADNSQYATVEPAGFTVHGQAGTTTVAAAGVTLPNATQVVVGSFDNSTGGAHGISLICAVGYELNWQGGRLRSVQVGGDGTPVPIYLDSPIWLPAAGVTFHDSTTQTTAWTGALAWE